MQTGGPSGGCIPQEMFDTPVDYETLAQLGSIMGSGGMVVMDEDNCMVDVARYFIEFTHSESCGKCVPCRVGLDKALRILNAFTRRARHARRDLEPLDEIGRMIRDTSLCGLGQTAPNPVLTTMRHFRHEFEDHIRAKRCRAGRVRRPGAFAVREQLPAAHEHPALPELYKEGRLEEAFESVVMDNPLPASTGRVCQHPCDNRCRRRTLDDAVNMREVHRFIADSIYQSDRFDALAERIRGAQAAADGPQGGGGRRRARPDSPRRSTWRCWATRSRSTNPIREAGGMLRYALPEYRLPKRVLRREVELIRRLGVKFVCDVRGGHAISRSTIWTSSTTRCSSPSAHGRRRGCICPARS